MSALPASTQTGLKTWQKVLWAAFLVTLPVTSFPFFPRAMGGEALVRPMSLYPLILLLPLVTLPFLFRKSLPRTFLAFIPFIVLALVSSLVSLTRGIEPDLGVSVDDRVLRAVITLGIGAAIYITVTMLPRDSQDLRFTLRWLYIGFAIALLWGTFQAVYVVNFSPEYFNKIQHIQDFISFRKLIRNRVSGMTYEPNWFAEQITFLLLPFLLSSVLSGQSVFRWRWRFLRVEWFLLAWAIALLPFTFSRAGVLNLVILVFIGVLFFRFPGKAKAVQKIAPSRRFLRSAIEALLLMAAIAGIIFYAGTKNEFFARLWGYWEHKNATLSGFFDYIGFGARLTYSGTAFNMYEAYPLLGVGLGNYAFYFEQMLPDQPLAELPEVLHLVTPGNGRERLVTSKNFYLRLLSETGILGTVAFFAFLIAIVGNVLYLRLATDPRPRYWGTAGFLGLIAFLLAALSFDSFAIPNMWVVFGLATAASRVFSPENQADKGTTPGSAELPLPVSSHPG
ncbi:MAG: O-antigen ligase family protein [Anaerolineales bacterium]